MVDCHHESVSRSCTRQYYRQRRTAAAKTPKPVITAASSLTDALSNPSATPLDALANILDINRRQLACVARARSERAR